MGAGDRLHSNGADWIKRKKVNIYNRVCCVIVHHRTSKKKKEAEDENDKRNPASLSFAFLLHFSQRWAFLRVKSDNGIC